MSKIRIVILFLLTLMNCLGSCYREVRTRSECESLLFTVLVFKESGAQAIAQNPSFDADEKQRRLEANEFLGPLALGLYSDCISKVPENPENPLEFL